MFENLDDPNPPLYDPDAVARRIRAIAAGRRHRRQVYGSALAAAVVAAGGITYSATLHRSTIDVITGPPPAGTACPNQVGHQLGSSCTSAPPPSSGTGSPIPPGAITIPNLVGLDAATAGEKARTMGLPVDIEAEMVRSSRPAGTVVAQDPPPGVRAAAVALTVAVPVAPPCGSSQLTLALRGAAASTGTGEASLLIRDTSASWCTLNGPLTVAGTDSTNHPDTVVVAAKLLRPIILSPHSALPADGQPPPVGTIDASILISAPYRDLAAGPYGGCTNHQVVPAAWRVTVSDGGRLSAPNTYPGQPPRSMLTCQGRLEVSAPVQLLSG